MRAVLLFAAALLAHGSENPVAFSLSGNVPRAGASATVRLNAKIESGWHLYGLTQPDDGPRPTRIWLPEDQPYKLTKPVKAPAGKRKFDENFNMEVEYFEGQAVFQLPIEASGAGPLRVSVQYQACNDRMCLPPKTVTVER